MKIQNLFFCLLLIILSSCSRDRYSCSKCSASSDDLRLCDRSFTSDVNRDETIVIICIDLLPGESIGPSRHDVTLYVRDKEQECAMIEVAQNCVTVTNKSEMDGIIEEGFKVDMKICSLDNSQLNTFQS